MKLLMFDAGEFWYKTHSRTLASEDQVDREEGVEDALVVFVQVEAEDENNGAPGKVVRKAVKNIHWLAGKTARRRIVVHSFGHLSNSKCSTGFAKDILEGIVEKLTAKGYETHLTPFGYFLEFRIHVRGESLAKVWKEV